MTVVFPIRKLLVKRPLVAFAAITMLHGLSLEAKAQAQASQETLPNAPTPQLVSYVAPPVAPHAESAQPAHTPQPQQTSYFDWSTLTGNWDGLRTTLQQHGFEPFVFYTVLSSGNPRGGYSQGHFTMTDDWYMGMRLDLKKIVGWNGATITISGVNRDGRGLTNEYIKSQYNVQQDVGGQNLFFYQFFLKKYFNHDQGFLKVGRFGASDDFNASPIYGLYLNNGINGDIRNVLFDTQFSAYPFSTWAGMYRNDWKNGAFLEVGAFQTWKNIFNSQTNGVDWTFHKGDGVIGMVQAGVTTHLHQHPSVDSSQPTPDASVPTAQSAEDTQLDKNRLEGHYWFGSTFSPWKGYTQFNSSALASNSYGFYFHADQRVWEEAPASKRNVLLWGTLGYYPQQNISIVPFQATVGFIYQGLFTHRLDDKTVFAVIYGHFSRDYAKQQMKAGSGDPSYEAVIEGGHRFQVSKFLFMQPDLQWVIRPSGTGRYRNAIAAGAEMGVIW